MHNKESKHFDRWLARLMASSLAEFERQAEPSVRMWGGHLASLPMILLVIP